VTQGVLTRSVRDTANFYAGAEAYWRNPRLPPVRSVVGPGRTRLRIGVLLDSPNGVATDDETRACVQSTADLLSRLGHHVEETTSPVGARFADDFSLYWALLGLLVTSTGRRVIDPGFDATRTDDLTRGLARMCRRRLAGTPGMLYRLRRVTQASEDAFEPAWSPDGQTIAYSRAGSIVTIDPGGANVSVLTDPDGNDSSPDWNPRPTDGQEES